ncbi:MFS transporter [Nocardia sp. NPDC127579]|uniref:MFS transporter n=1 Tax=Nocardia sp. NPDC127579 TaxID=3345402 RepID=UPI003628D009
MDDGQSSKRATTSGEFPQATRKEWIGVAILTIPCLIISMDLSVLYFALPHISEDLAPSSTEQLWILDSYGFLLAGLLITMGALGDRIGRRLLLLVGATAFGLASALAAFATTPEMLIGARALMGIAGATLMPSTLALIRTMFVDPKQRTQAIGIWNGGLAAGAALGPVLGGALLEQFWWGSVFFMNVPVMLLLVVCGPFFLPETKDGASGRIDLVSAAVSIVAMLTLIQGIKEWARVGLDLPIAALILIGVALFGYFGWRQLRVESPLIEPALLRVRAVSGAITVNLVMMFSFFGCALFTTQFLQMVLGYDTLKAGLWFLTAMPPGILAMVAAVEIAKRVRPMIVVCTGIAIGAAGGFLLCFVTPDSSVWYIMAAQSALTAGVLVATTLTADTILTTAPPERAGAASALTETGTEFGSAVGIAVLGAVGAGIFRDRLAEAEVTGSSIADLPATARETVVGALQVAAELPAEAGAALRTAAVEAFTDSIDIVGLVGGGVLVVGTVLSAVLLAAVRSPGTVDESVTAELSKAESSTAKAE